MKAIDRCALCPRLCRTACPVATGAAREAAVPAQIAGAVLAHRQGRLPDQALRDAITSCVDCGACQDLCHLHVPLPDALRALRREWATAPAPPSVPPPDEGEVLVVITPPEAEHEEPYLAAVQRRVRASVGRWLAPRCLGEGSLEHPRVDDHFAALRAAAAGRRVVTAHHGVEDVLRAAGVAVVPLWDLAGLPAPRRCGEAGGPIACCGGRSPFVEQHPEDALRMGAHWLRREGPTRGLDVRCTAHLRAAGAEASSVLEVWLHGEATDA